MKTAEIKEHIIWQDEDLNLDDWRDDLLAADDTLTEDEMYSRMYELNGEYLEDERMNLSSAIAKGGIIIVADLGLWNGRRQGCRMVESGKISDCLSTREQGSAAWYVDSKGEFCARIHHHDGTNYYRYRGIRPGVSSERIEDLQELIYTGQEYETLLRKLTYRLGDLIGDVYGWTFGHRPKCSVAVR